MVSETPLMLPADAAAYLHTTVDTLAWFRKVRKGPCFVRLGRRIFYRKMDLDDYIGDHVTDPSDKA